MRRRSHRPRGQLLDLPRLRDVRLRRGWVPLTPSLVVECPDCGLNFETVYAGDVVVCKNCENHFNRFTNVVDVLEEGSK